MGKALVGKALMAGMCTLAALALTACAGAEHDQEPVPDGLTVPPQDTTTPGAAPQDWVALDADVTAPSEPTDFGVSVDSAKAVAATSTIVLSLTGTNQGAENVMWTNFQISASTTSGGDCVSVGAYNGFPKVPQKPGSTVHGT